MDRPGVRLLIEPGEIGLNQCAGRFGCGQRHRHRTPKVRLKPGLDGALGPAAFRLDGAGVFKHPAGDLGRRPERALEGLKVLRLSRLDDASKRVGILFNQCNAVLPDAPQSADEARMVNQFFKEGGRQGSAERRNASSADP